MSFFILPSCGSEFVGLPSDKDFDNPVDPILSENTGQVGGGGGETEGTGEGSTCLENCSPPAGGSSLMAVKSLDFIGTGCEVDGVKVVRNESANRFTIVYRAKYQSEGIWQLYARNVTVASDGTMSLIGSGPTNLFPGRCIGNTSGVTNFSISEYRAPTMPTRAFDTENASNVTEFKVDMTCYSSALNDSNIFYTDSLTPSPQSTVAFLKTLGAVGYERGRNIYIKSDGTSLNTDGSANSFTIPGISTVTRIFGTDAAGGMYFMSGAYSSHYLSAAGAVSAYNTSNAEGPSGGSGGIYIDGAGFHSIHGFFTYNYSSDRVETWNLKSRLTQSPDLGSSKFVGFKNDKLLLIESYNPNKFLTKFDFTTGTSSKISEYFASYEKTISPMGLWNSKALMYDATGKCTFYMSGDFF